MSTYIHTLATCLGKIAIAGDQDRISHLFLPGEPVPSGFIAAETPLLREAARQLQSYLAGQRQSFDLPLDPQGTPFMRRVWQALLEIPYGETRSYGDIARAVGNPKACRAVGQANHRNPISIFIPCHRVIGSSGQLVGYGGGLEIKEFLLRLEGNPEKKGDQG